MKISNKFFAELFGTFVLVFGGCGTALFGNVGFLGVAIAFGLTVVAMAYGIGHISGAHLNPAVSFGVFVNGRMTFKEMIVYWLAQFIGGIIAGALLLVIWKATGNGDTGVFAANGFDAAFQKATGAVDPHTGAPMYAAINMWGAFLVEALLTFVFLMVILGVTDSRHANGKFGGLAIGLTLVLIHLISIPLTNTSVNPARSLGVALFSKCATWNAMSQVWLFIVAPLVGALLAGLVYKCLGGCCKKEK
ncbi:MAG: MIP family channel protein [Bacteroidales bacterium]|nr:MIP family channel protein [Bacteroidales bacterium]